MVGFIHTYDNLLDVAACAHLIGILDAGPITFVRSPGRQCAALVLDPWPPAVRSAVQSGFTRYMDGVGNVAGCVLRAARWIERPKLVRYVPGDDFKEHPDRGDEISSSRAVSIVIYLNDVKGGELVFPRQAVTVQPARGRAVYFPSDFTHTHEARTPVDGRKDVLTTWMRFAPNDYTQPI